MTIAQIDTLTISIPRLPSALLKQARTLLDRGNVIAQMSEESGGDQLDKLAAIVRLLTDPASSALVDRILLLTRARHGGAFRSLADVDVQNDVFEHDLTLPWQVAWAVLIANRDRLASV